MFKIYIIIFFVFLFSCENKSDAVAIKSSTNKIVEEKKEIDYPTFLTSVDSIKLKDKLLWQNNFFNYINKDVPQYWTGTPWDFNGVTTTPNQGSIACGYFVTNTLAAYGISLKRVYLAQQVSAKMIATLCVSNSIKRFTKIESLINYVNQRSKQEIYIVGLDFHTGYIIRNNDNIYFLHSNYIQNKGVMKEIATESAALNSSKNFMIGSVSTNAKLFR